MKLVNEPLSGVKLIEPFHHEDCRGAFVKTFHEEMFAELGIFLTVREEFFSISAKNVLRGMHFQIPPHAHQKLVFCTHGRVLDVLIDLRIGSPSYGQSASFELSAANRHLVHIPVGVAHGFLSLEDGSCLVYKTDTVHEPSADAGILWNSFDFDWPLTSKPILSHRDEQHPTLAEFSSPF